ncbi:MAG: M24 family metallopeptidase [Dehalococcoidia bacterium]
MYFATDWTKRVDFDAARQERATRLRGLMERHRLDGILAFEAANIRYISGLRPLWVPNFGLMQAALITRTSPHVICWPFQDDTPHRQATMYWMDPQRVRPFPGVLDSPTPAPALEVLRQGLEELGLTSGHLGLDFTKVPVLDTLRDMLPDIEIVDGDVCLKEARQVKGLQEVEVMRQASELVNIGFETALQAVEPGMRECEVLAEVMHTFYQYGMEIPQCNLIVCSGSNTAPMQRFAGDRVIQRGDLVFMDLGGCWHGMFSEAARTVICGEPNEQQRQLYQTVYNIHTQVIGAMKPGVTAAQLQQVAEQPYKASPFYGHMQRMLIAHGIGMGFAEPPWVPPAGVPPPDLTLEVGMTLAVVITILVPGIPGGGGVRLEDVVTVTPEGVEVMTGRIPYDEVLLS